eukprot:SAG31_NODE_512_length_14721_cov_17.995623_3_plen_80_part_00
MGPQPWRLVVWAALALTPALLVRAAGAPPVRVTCVGGASLRAAPRSAVRHPRRWTYASSPFRCGLGVGGRGAWGGGRSD